MENTEMEDGLGMMVAVWNINRFFFLLCGRTNWEDYNRALILHSLHT